MNNPVVISGEASETDSEDEEINVVPQKNLALSIHGAVISGEDSESENDGESSICSAVSALNQEDGDIKNLNYDSLLHQKLKECNIKVHNDMDGYCANTVDEAAKNLSVIDQQLLRSQVILQNATTSLKSLSAHSITLKNKLHSLLSAKFLPNITVVSDTVNK